MYQELLRMAGQYLRKERPGYTLQSAELVHEVYLRLIGARELACEDRVHFFAVAATLMRRVLVDRARRQSAAKRGARGQRVELNAVLDLGVTRTRELIALDDTLNTLAEVDSRKARIVELRFFGGLSVEETAQVLGVSADTVMRDWKLARAWILAELGGHA